MFTGLVQVVGRVRALASGVGDARLELAAPGLSGLQLGDSLAVNGVCLTVAALDEDVVALDVSAETLARSTLGALRVGHEVNLETALTPSARLGGHFVAGHVDGVGRVVERRAAGQSARLGIEIPGELAKYMAVKGCVAVDGCSLTTNEVAGSELVVNLIPHTLANTVARHYDVGTRVNIEVDLIARYVERLLHAERAPQDSGAGVTWASLARHGFLEQS